MRLDIREYTVPGLIEAMQKALVVAKEDLVKSKAQVHALEEVLNEVGEHCGIEGCVTRNWSDKRKEEHRTEAHPDYPTLYPVT